jgi:hypothetical protein
MNNDQATKGGKPINFPKDKGKPIAFPKDGGRPIAFPKNRKGGRVTKTGDYRLEKGEVIVPERIMKRRAKIRSATRNSGRR